MKSYISEYDLVLAGNLEEALHVLAKGENWRPIAGGTDLMVLLNGGKLSATRLVSIRDIRELRSIDITEEAITIGSAVTFTTLRRHPVLQHEFPLLPLAASWTGGIANQNRGTLGGNIINASPAADSPPALLAYDATITLLSQRGERTLPYREFHTGYKQMQLEPDELLCSITLPRKYAGWQYYSRKVGARKAQAISKVCMSALCAIDQRFIHDIRISMGSVAPVPLRCTATENVLKGCELTESVINNAKVTLHDELSPIDDIRSTATYRAQVAANLLGEFLSGLQ